MQRHLQFFQTVQEFAGLLCVEYRLKSHYITSASNENKSTVKRSFVVAHVPCKSS